MKLLITGAGLIGVNTARQALAEGHTVALLDRAPDATYLDQMLGDYNDKLSVIEGDICDLDGLTQTVKNQGADTVVHTAGLIGKRLEEDPYQGIQTNVMGSINVMEAARQGAVKRVVFLSSFGVYARDRITADRITEDAAVGRTRVYGATKVSTEQLIRAYAKRYNINTVVLRPAAVYGAGHYTGGSGIGIAMAWLMQQVMAGGTVQLPNRHFGSNEYLYCKDAAAAVLAACDPDLPGGRTYNLGAGVVHSVQQLADALTQWQPEIKLALDTGDPSPAITPLDVTAATGELGFRAKYSLERGLADYWKELLAMGFKPAEKPSL